MSTTATELVQLLKASEDFSSLNESILEEFAQNLKIQKVNGGEKVIQEGDESAYMFILVSGRLRVSREDRDGKLLLYNEVLPGDCVGETGMILEQARTADIYALRNSQLAVLDKPAYIKLLAKFPTELNKAFSHAIYRHLRHHKRISERKRAQSFFLVPIHSNVDMETVCQQFKLALNTMGKALVVGESAKANNSENFNQLDIDLDKAESEYDFILYQGNNQNLELCKQVFHHTDQLVFVGDGYADSEITDIETVLHQETGYELIRKHLVLLYPNSETLSASRIEWQKDRNIERVYPIKLTDQADYKRLGRFLTGRAVGVVLGGGGARGFAHIGVLKAFEEFGVPIDIIGGNSMGAVIGACYVSGMPLNTIHTRILELNKNGLKLTFPMVSLMSNKNLEKALIDGVGAVDIDKLWLPFFSAACNLTKAETTVLDEGPLWRAVLASNSPAGLFPPVVHNGELLVDGAVLENVPVQAMRLRLSTALERRRGNGTVIAIDVDIKEELQVAKELERLNNWTKLQSHFDPKKESLPGMFDILMQVAHIGGLTKRQSTRFSSDHYLEPPLSEFSLMDYKKAEDIIQAGYDYTVEQIKDWSWH